MLARPLALVLTLAVLVAGCGGDDDSAPVSGPPAGRHGADAVAGLLAVERVRARLVPASDLYAVDRRPEALLQLRQARRAWSAVSGRVRAGDAVLEREVSAAFARVEAAMSRGTSFDTVRDRLAPLATQLLDGVAEELVEKDARLDPGVKAAVVVRLTRLVERAYADGVRAGGGPGRLALEHAFGLIDRSQAVAGDIASDLGPQRGTVLEGLRDLRETAFPDEIELPAEPAPAGEVRERSARVRAALVERFELARAAPLNAAAASAPSAP